MSSDNVGTPTLPFPLSGAILVGGAARRLGGRPKGRLEIDGRSIAARQIEVLTAIGATPILFIGKGDTGRPDLPAVADAIEGAGALGGVYTALLSASARRVLVLANDLPFVTVPFLVELARQAEGVQAVVPRTDAGSHPLCALYDRSAATVLKELIDAGVRRIRDALGHLRVREIEPALVARYDADGRLLTNVNTPDDYETARRR